MDIYEKYEYFKIDFVLLIGKYKLGKMSRCIIFGLYLGLILFVFWYLVVVFEEVRLKIDL